MTELIDVDGEKYDAECLVTGTNEYYSDTTAEEKTTARECAGARLLHGLALMVQKLAEARRDDLDSVIKRVEVEMSAAAKEADEDPGEPDRPALTFGDARIIAEGCHDYGGGYRNTEEAEIFHHGITTVCNALKAAHRDGGGLQVAVLKSIGAAAARAKVNAAESVTEFADRMAHRFTETAKEFDSLRPASVRGLAFRDAANLLREEAGL